MNGYPDSLINADFTKVIRVYYEDTDAGGVVYHSQYLNFMERCRSDWLADNDLSVMQLNSQFGIVVVVGEVTIKYHAPARLGDDLTVTCRVLQVGKVRISLQQTVYNQQQLLCSATIKLATLDATSFTVTAMPSQLAEHFSTTLTNQKK